MHGVDSLGAHYSACFICVLPSVVPAIVPGHPLPWNVTETLAPPDNGKAVFPGIQAGP